MDFWSAVKTCFKKYATFEGRASRSEFWYFTLFTMLVNAALMIVFGSHTVFADLFSLVALLPSIAVSVRRLHDTDRSGWWWWLWLLPVVGWILLIVWYCTKGTAAVNYTDGENRFGKDPLKADI